MPSIPSSYDRVFETLALGRRAEIAALARRTVRLEALHDAYRRLGALTTTAEIAHGVVSAARALAPEGRVALIDRNQIVAAADASGPCEMMLSTSYATARWTHGDARDLNAPVCCGVGAYACGMLGRSRLALYLDGLEAVDEAFAWDFQAFAAFAGVVVTAVRAAEADRLAATTDALTGLWNRRALEYRLRVAIDERKPFTYAIVDLDKFKQINDTLGHQAGDAVLRKVGETLRQHTRASDYPARLAGDEFVVLLDDATGGAAERVREWLARAGIAASVGAALFPRDGSDPQALYAAADRRLYAAKAERRSS